jgi:hypothetical protein
MIKLSVRSVLALGLFIVLATSTMMTVAAAGTEVSKAGPTELAQVATPTVAATLTRLPLHVPGAWDVPGPAMRLHVTGANFAPGAQVKLAVINTDNLKVLHTGSTYVQPTMVWRGTLVLNPLGGTFEYTAIVSQVPPDTPIHLWCRSTGHMDIHEVTLE